MAFMGISEADARSMFRSMFAEEVAEPKAEIRKLKEKNETLSKELSEWMRKCEKLDQLVEAQTKVLQEGIERVTDAGNQREKELTRIISDHLNKNSDYIDRELSDLNESVERNGETMRKEVATVLQETSARHVEVLKSALINFDREVETLYENSMKRETELCVALENFQSAQDEQSGLINRHSEILDFFKEEFAHGQKASEEPSEQDRKLDSVLNELSRYIQEVQKSVGELEISLGSCDKRLGSLEILSAPLPQIGLRESRS